MMDPSRRLGLLEEDLETTAYRSSSDGSEEDAFINKTPIISARQINRFQREDYPIKRQPPWKRYLFPLQRFRGKSRNHDKEFGNDYLQSAASSVRRRRKNRRCTICLGLLTFVFALFGLYNVITILIGLGPLLWDPDFDQFFPNWGQPGQPGEGLSGYPTDFTRDVLPIPCHSHNDYWRRIPLYEALHYGCTGVEADVWLFREDLFVGHTSASLSRNRTFRSLYVDPLVRLLEEQNPVTEFTSKSGINGVFDEDPSQTLVLLVDYKNDGADIHPYVESQLSALRERNYLTYYDGSSVIPGPITVVATGNAPFGLITANSTYRDIFFDAPLDKLSSSTFQLNNHPNLLKRLARRTTTAGQGNTDIDPSLGSAQFDATNSFYASVNFKNSIGFPWRGRLSEKQKQKLRDQIAAAREKGLKPRYWGTPAWPIGLRNHIWWTLVQEGAAYLNVDDLRGAAKADWRRKQNREW